MYLVYAWERDEAWPSPEEIPDIMRGPFLTLKDAFRGVEVLKVDLGTDSPLVLFDCKTHLQGAGPHSAGRMCMDFTHKHSQLVLRIVEFVK